MKKIIFLLLTGLFFIGFSQANWGCELEITNMGRDFLPGGNNNLPLGAKITGNDTDAYFANPGSRTGTVKDFDTGGKVTFSISYTSVRNKSGRDVMMSIRVYDGTEGDDKGYDFTLKSAQNGDEEICHVDSNRVGNTKLRDRKTGEGKYQIRSILY